MPANFFKRFCLYDSILVQRTYHQRMISWSSLHDITRSLHNPPLQRITMTLTASTLSATSPSLPTWVALSRAPHVVSAVLITSRGSLPSSDDLLLGRRHRRKDSGRRGRIDRPCSASTRSGSVPLVIEAAGRKHVELWVRSLIMYRPWRSASRRWGERRSPRENNN